VTQVPHQIQILLRG